ncbi:MAG: DUF5320 domain-containing protein [Candidatus Margulisbacteria bacterium]|nr:DUF5320 domain-containing protein [Candidatus Margulisiibacteriota bacterium]
MPRRDGTGPMGQGPMTGRGMGACAPNTGSIRNFFGFGRGRGAGMGHSRGMGLGRMMPWNWETNKTKDTTER